MIGRTLFRQRVRTLLTVLGVSIGVAGIVGFGAVARGFWVSTNGVLHCINSDLAVFQAGVAVDLFSTLDERATREILAADPDVAESAAALWHVLPVQGHPFMMVMGLRPEEFACRDQGLVRGRGLQSDDDVVIGVIAERTLGKSVGDVVSLAGRPYRIAGVVHTGVVFFDGGIGMTLNRLQTLAVKPGRVTTFQVRLRPGADSRAVARRIEAAHPDLAVIRGAEEFNKIDQGLEIANGMVWAVTAMAVLIGGLIVTNTMWMSVYERTREIGVLRAVGWSRNRVVTLIVLESVAIALIACVVGCAGGVGLARLSAKLPVATRFVDPVFEISLFALALAAAVPLGVLGGALPAWRAARVSPVEALRHE